MALTSAHDRYGTVAISIHWLSAILIIILLVSGFRAGATDDMAAKAFLLRIHLPMALLLLLLTAFRIVWWLKFDDRPDPVAGTLRSQEHMARAVHLLFYVVVLGMIASGVGMILLSGGLPLIFSTTNVALPEFWRYPPRVPHVLGARLMVALLVVHLAAALYHQFVRRDKVLRRIWFAD